jgi:hypothetical protein
MWAIVDFIGLCLVLCFAGVMFDELFKFLGDLWRILIGRPIDR